MPPNYLGGRDQEDCGLKPYQKKVTENPSQPTSQEKWSIPMITDMQEVVGRKIAVQASPGKNVKP
jgi:hypothetical protein